MERIEIVSAALIISFLFSIHYSSSNLKRKARPKTSLARSFRISIKPTGISGIVMACMHLNEKGIFKDIAETHLIENFIISAILVGVILVPIFLVLIVIFFEKFINWLLGNRELPPYEKRIDDNLQLNHSYTLLISKSDPTSIKTNPVLIPYEIF